MKKEIVLILLVGLIPLLWYKEGTIALGHDMSFPLSPVDFFLDRLYVWTDRIGTFGSNQTDAVAAIFIHGLEALFTYLGLSLVNTQKLTFIFWFTLPGITMFTLLRSLHPKKEDFLIRLSGSLFYMMNHYLLQAWIIAERTKFSIVAALPLVTLFIINSIYKKGSILSNSLLVSLTLFILNGGSAIPLWGGLFIATFTTLVMVCILSSYSKIEKIKRFLLFSLLSLAFTLLLNFYWFYPYVSSFTQNYTQRINLAGGVDAAVSWSQEISRNTSFSNLLRMQGVPDWYENLEHPYSNNFLDSPFLIIISLVFPSIAFLGLIKRNGETKEDSIYRIIFLSILIVGIPFAAGSHPPFGKVYDFLLKEVPGFSIFRTPFYKFGMVIWFAFSYLIAIGLKYCLEKLSVTTLSKLTYKFISIFTLAIFILILFTYNYPYFTGIFFNWSKQYSTMVKVPTYIYDAIKELENDKYFGRTLFIPDLDSRTQHVSYSWNYFSLATIPDMSSRKPIVINDATLLEGEKNLINGVYEELRSRGTSNLLKYTGSSKLVLANDFYVPQDLYYQNEDIKSNIAKNRDFIFDKKIGEWEFFNVGENIRVMPKVFASSKVSFIESDHANLLLLAVMPGAYDLGDLFILSDIKKPQSITSAFINKYIIEGSCTNCEESKKFEFLSVTPSKILPGSKLYFLLEAVDKYRKGNIKDPKQRIDFILLTILKRSKTLDTLIKNVENTKTVKEVINNFEDNLNEIRKIYLGLLEVDKNGELREKLYLYLWSFVLSSQNWYLAAADPVLREQLLSYESNLRQIIEDFNFVPNLLDSSDDKEVKYKLDIQRKARYRINLYNIFDENNNFFIDQTNVPLKKVDSKWFQSDLVDLEPRAYNLKLVTERQKSNYFLPFKIEAAPGRTSCEEIHLSKPIKNINYKVKSKFQKKGREIKAYVIVQGKFKTETRIFPSLIQARDDPLFNQLEFSYNIAPYTTDVYLKFCLDGEYLSPSTAFFTDFEVVSEYPTPQVFAFFEDISSPAVTQSIEYVALNQTKYLIKVENSKDDFILQFNSRFDQNWHLREVNSRVANTYFIGKPKGFLSGKAKEYPIQDVHVLTDLLFPSEYRSIIKPSLVVNGFSNGFLVKGVNSDGERTFLLEYSLQNTLYKSSVVSFLTLTFMLLLYGIKRK